jgi:hypothetical protein
MDVLGNLLFFSLSSVVLLLFFGFAIHFFVRGLLCGYSRPGYESAIEGCMP